MGRKKIILISENRFVNSAKRIAREGYEIKHFSTAEDFFKETARIRKKRQNEEFIIKPDSDITKYFDYDVNEPDYFWVVEQLSDNIQSIVKPIVKLRWLGYETPILVSSFVEINNSEFLQKYNLPSLFDQTQGAETYLKLPVSTDDFCKALISAKKSNVNGKALKYVIDNNQILSHDLQYEPYSNVINKDNNMKLEEKSQLVKNETDNKLPIHTLKILIVDNNDNDLEGFKKLFDECNDKGKYPDIDICAETELFQSVDNVIKRCGEITDLQCVLLDWQLAEKDNPTPELLKKIKEFRPNLPVYILTATQMGCQIVDESKGVDEFLTKDELRKNTNDVLRRIVSRFNDRRATPFWTAFEQYVINNTDTWHTPGHERGESFKKSDYLLPFFNFWGENVFSGDLSISADSLGSLLDSTGFIGEAQKKTAKTFGTRKTFFATNGSSTSNKIMLQSIIKPGDKVIVDRNCHKSVHYACIQAGADVVYLESEYSKELDIFAPPALSEIESKLNTNKDAKVVVITGCTYDGLLINIERLMQKIKQFNEENKTNVKLFIDEAWFAYSGFHPDYAKYSAVRNKADYITHSTHKVLSAFSQASYLHINDEDIDEDFFREIYYIYTSTSPQYQIIASLDVASMQMEMEGYQLIKTTKEKAKNFIDKVNHKENGLKHIKVLCKKDLIKSFEKIDITDDVGHDELKVTLDIRGLNRSKDEVLKFLREHGKIEIEKSTKATVLVLFTIGVTDRKITSLYNALKKLDEECENSKAKKKENQDEDDENISIPSDIELIERPYESFYDPNIEMKKISKIREYIDNGNEILSARLVTPYPPGIPLLVPGQKIKPSHLTYLEKILQDNIEVHGCSDKELCIINKKKENGNVS